MVKTLLCSGTVSPETNSQSLYHQIPSKTCDRLYDDCIKFPYISVRIHNIINRIIEQSTQSIVTCVIIYHI